MLMTTALVKRHNHEPQAFRTRTLYCTSLLGVMFLGLGSLLIRYHDQVLHWRDSVNLTKFRVYDSESFEQLRQAEVHSRSKRAQGIESAGVVNVRLHRLDHVGSPEACLSKAWAQQVQNMP